MLDGGRSKWEGEERDMTTDVPRVARSTYEAPERHDAKIRAFMRDVREHMDAGGRLIDVRSPDEFTGKKLHLPQYPHDCALPGRHIPGATSVPWARAANPDRPL